MYSHKENVNILTALLVAHGVRHAVVCPGSRNAPIVHNLDACPDVKCYPVTDERSAGFFALGLAQATDAPVVVCVTSGTALLNLAPAVAEAYYQHRALIVVSADRPPQWIGQLDGQTLPQPDALGRFVRRSVTLPESDAWYCNRLVNEALLDATTDDARPVHINVPISEPLFDFDVAELPVERKITRFFPLRDYECLPPEFIEGMLSAQRPMIVFGQTSPFDFDGSNVEYLFSHVIVLHESLSPFPSVSHFDEVLYRLGHAPEQLQRLLPDFVVYVGDTIVSKRLRHFLRSAGHAQVWRVSRSGDVEDTFTNLHGLIVGDAEFVLQALSQRLQRHKQPASAYRRQWLHLLSLASAHAQTYEPAFSQLAAVKSFEAKYATLPAACHVHYANSTSVRLANLYAAHYVWCNRGVNGIEGSLSVAAGFSAAVPGLVFCVIGDLSFFYDQNALWNRNLGGNLRILLLNNGQGGIFRQLRGLEQSPARDAFVAAQHATSAEGICRQNNIGYRSARTLADMQQGLEHLLTADSQRPLLLEVVTDAATDTRVLRDYYATVPPMSAG